MITKSMQYAVCLGLAGGFTVAIAPAVRAQIQVTGGNVSGQAAFFVPLPGTSGANVELFDVAIQRLRLETNRGNTSTAIFTPTAARFDAGSDNLPNAGDKGTLQGVLAGIAFSANGGTPIPFANRQTVLDFTLNRFSSNLGEINGTLISPQTTGQAPLVFLPNTNATLASDSSFQATRGELQLGDFDAKLDRGLIDLPSSLVFRETGGASVASTTLTRRLKFTFEGENVRPEDGTDFDADDDNDDDDDDNTIGNGNFNDDDDDDFDDDDNTIGNGNFNDDDNDDDDDDDDDDDGNRNIGRIRFVGAANRRFEIQSAGSSGNGQFNIRGNTGALDISISRPFNLTSDDDLDDDDLINSYRIQGESDGIASLFAPNSLAFRSTNRRDVSFRFVQGDDTLEGRSTGNFNFYAVAGTNSFNRDTQFTNYRYSDFDRGSNTTAFCNICSAPVAADSFINVGSSLSDDDDDDDDDDDFNRRSGNISIFNRGEPSFSNTANVQYRILSSGNTRLSTDIDDDDDDDDDNDDDNNVGRIRVNLVQRGGDRYYVVTRDGSGATPSSRTRQVDDDDDDDDGDDRTTSRRSNQTGSNTTPNSSRQANNDDDDDDNDDDDDDDNDRTTSRRSNQTGSNTTPGSTRQANNDDDDDDNDDDDDDDDDRTTSRRSNQTGSNTTPGSTRQANNDDDDDDDDNDTNASRSRSSQQVVFKIVGPSSRAFPGLVGLQQLSAEEAAKINNTNTSTSSPRVDDDDDDDDNDDDN